MRVDFSLPSYLVTYYHIIGSISLILNTGTIFLLIFKSSKLDNFRFYLLTFQIMCTFVDFHLTFLMQPVPLYPIVGGYCNGFLAVHLDVWSHHLMNVILTLMLAQMQCLAFCFIRKHQTLAKILNHHKISDYVFVSMIFLAISFLFIETVGFGMSAVPREQLMSYVAVKYPDYVTDFSKLSNFSLYQLDSIWLLSVWTFAVLLTLLLGGVYSFTSIEFLRMLKETRGKISASHFQKHRIAIRSLFAQLAASFVCVIPPFFFEIVIITEMEHSQLIVQILLIIFAMHSSVNATVLVITTPPFRQFVFRTKKNLTRISVPVSGKQLVMT